MAIQKEEELLELERNDRGDYLYVTHIEQNGKLYYDIRHAFTNDEDKIIKLKKGVRIKEDEIAEILAAIIADLSDSKKLELKEKLAEYEDGVVLDDC